MITANQAKELAAKVNIFEREIQNISKSITRVSENGNTTFSHYWDNELSDEDKKRAIEQFELVGFKVSLPDASGFYTAASRNFITISWKD